MGASLCELEELGLFFPGGRAGVLLVHGLTGTPAELKFVARRLNQYGFTVLCPRLAGHCSTEAELLGTTWRDWADSVLSAYDRLARQCDAIFVGGLSAGAVLSLHAGHERPGTRGLMLYSTTLWWDGWTIPRLRFLLPLILRLPYIGKRYRFAETPPYGIKNEALRRKIAGLMQSGDAESAGFPGTPGYSLREMWRLVDRIKTVLPEIETPSLLLHSSHDDIAAISNANYVLDHIGGPARLVQLHNSYHMITVDQERDKVADQSAAFAASLLSRTELEALRAHAGRPLPSLHADGDSPEVSAKAAETTGKDGTACR